MVHTDFLKSQNQYAGNYFYLSIGLGLSSGIFIVIQAWLLANIINVLVFESASSVEIKRWMIALPVIFIARACLTWAAEASAFESAALVKRHLRNQLQHHLFAVGPIGFSTEHSGKISNTLLEGIEALENYYARYLPAMALMALIPVAILVIVIPIDWLSGIVLAVTAPLIPFFMILIGKGTERLNNKQWLKLARMNTHFLDMIQGLGTLKLFNASKREAQAIATISDDYRKATMSVLRVAFLSSLALEFLATMGIAMVAVLIGFRLYYGEMQFSHGFFALLLAPEFYFPLRNMGTHYHARLEAIGAAESMTDILNLPVLPNNMSGQRDFQGQINSSQEFAGSIDINLRNIHSSYPQRGKVLDDFTLHIQAGKRTALVGYSGSGKSTVANLLLGFIQPDKGNILINEIRLEELGIEHWRNQIAWISQRPHIFFDSIRHNICLGHNNTSDEELYHAAESACIHGFIQSLPRGYDTVIGEKGAGLSGGQIQRIALARAFLKNSPFVILDEATANLDYENERLLQKSINHLAENRTLLVIAHRLPTIQNADTIAVVDAGKVIESGTHQALIRQNGLYRKLHKTLSQDVVDQ